jgi:lipoate-protein ligase A
MKLLELTLPTAEENLALDEALLDEAEQSGGIQQTLRLWESPIPIIVVGRSSKVPIEVNLSAARRTGTPILRRSSGGAAIVAAPGCLMYAVVLSYDRNPQLHMLDEAHRFVLGHLQMGLQSLGIVAELRGTSDLVVQGRKFSGNSLRCKRTHLLYHGTLLCREYRAGLIGELLGTPPRQPDYREGRRHSEFVTVLPAGVAEVRKAIAEAWPIDGTMTNWPQHCTSDLVATRYSQSTWNLEAV